MQVREKWFSYRQMAPRRTRLSPKAAEPTIIVAFATVFDAEIARVAAPKYRDARAPKYRDARAPVDT